MRTLSGFSLGRGRRRGAALWYGGVFLCWVFSSGEKGEADVSKFHIRLPFDKWF